MRKVRHLTLTAEKRTAYTDLVKNVKKRLYTEDLGTDVRIILKCTLTT
jgi:hypothetical protein